MAKDDFEDFLSRITFAESRGKRTDSSGKLLEGPMTKYGTAKGELQVLDSTNKRPGYGIVPAKDETPDERARVGRDYLKAMLDKFKDKRTAAIAYNWGPGNTQKWLDAGADEAGLPLETQNYVKKVMGTGAAVAKAPAPPDMAPAPRQAAGAPAVPSSPANRPVVSRETVGPGTKETTVGVGPETVPAEDRLSALGPSYQAAMALSYLADTTNPAPQEEDEDGELRISGDEPRSTAREDDDVTNFLMEPSARTALADFDFKIQSPFAERPVKRMSGGGDPELTQEELDAASRPSFGNPNMARQAAKTRSLQAARSNDVNTLPDPQTYAFTQGMLGVAPDQMGFSPTHPDYKKIISRGEQGMVTGGVSMIGPAAKALKGLVGMGAKTLKPAASAAEISKDFLQRQKAVSSGPDGAARMAIAQRNAALPIEQGGLGLPANNTAMDRAAAMGFDTDVFHGTSKDFLTFNPDKEVFAAELPEIANLYGKYRKGDGQRIMPLKIRGKQLTISDMDDAGKNNQFGYNLAKKLNLSDDEIEKLLIPQVRYPNGELIPGVKNSTTTFSDLGEREIINRLPKYGIDRLKVIDMDDMGGPQTQYMLPAGSDNVRSSFAAYDPFRRTAAVAAAMGAAAPDLLAGQEVNRAKGSPEEGEVSQEEIDAASKPSFRAQSSGMNRKRGPISDALTSGEAYTAAAKGFTNLPYNIAGAPMDLAMIVRQGLTGQAPAGQVGTSDWIKNKMTELGIRQAPPTDPTLKGFYELGDLGSNLVNPAAPVRGAVKVAEKTGEAAKMLAKDFQQYNRQLEAPGASYAVRAKGTPVVMSPLREPTPDIMTDNFLLKMDKAEENAFFAKYPDIASWEYKQIRNTPEFKNFSASFLAPRDEAANLISYQITQPLAPPRMGGPPVSVDPALNNWFLKTFSRYLRSDFASPSDQLVRAAEEGKLLHLAPKELWFDNDANRELGKYLGSNQPNLKNTREAEGFPKYGMAKTEYGQRIEDLTDLSAYPEAIADLSPNRVPISMRGLVATNPEARAMDFSPDMVKNLKLDELRDKMLEIRQSNGQYSAYGQPAVKIPPEFLLPDDTLAKLNVAAASNRVARFTGWQEEARQGMATTALRTDPRFRRDLSSDGKYISVFVPDLAKPANQELIGIVTDVGCDGGWCTMREGNALGYGSGDRSLSIVLTNDGKKARPVAQVSVESRGTRGSSKEVHNIVDIAGKNNSYDFANNPALPVIQEHVKELDYIYGGLEDIAYLKQLGMMRIPRDSQQPAGVIEFGVSANMRHVENLLSSTTDAKTHDQLLKHMTLLKTLYGDKAEGLRRVVDEAVKLNEKSSLLVGNEDTMSKLLQQALQNVITPQKRATGGFMERQSNDNRKYL